MLLLFFFWLFFFNRGVCLLKAAFTSHDGTACSWHLRPESLPLTRRSRVPRAAQGVTPRVQPSPALKGGVSWRALQNSCGVIRGISREKSLGYILSMWCTARGGRRGSADRRPINRPPLSHPPSSTPLGRMLLKTCDLKCVAVPDGIGQVFVLRSRHSRKCTLTSESHSGCETRMLVRVFFVFATGLHISHQEVTDCQP